MKQNFIQTTDKITADKLTSAGLKLVSNIGQVYTFLNEPKIFNFEKIDKKKIVYTNILNV